MLNLLAVNLPVIVDVVSLVFVSAFVIYGYAKGFVKQFLSVFGTILSLLLAVVLCTSVAGFLENQFKVVTTVSNGLGGVFTNLIGDKVMNTTLTEATEGYLNDHGMPIWLINIVLEFVSEGSLPMDTTLNQIICPTFAYYIVIACSAVGLFIVFKILFFLLSKIINKLHSIRLVAILDNTLGIVLGLVSGIIYLELIIIVVAIIPVPAFQSITIAIQNSFLTNFISKISLYNIILNAISTTNVIGYVKNLVLTNLPV